MNDHIALRTFNVGVVALEECAKPFLAMGYEEKETYFFDTKKLRAKHYERSGSYPQDFYQRAIGQ